jgi:hypothetical protein
MNRSRLLAVAAATTVALAGLTATSASAATAAAHHTVAFADVVAGSVTVTGPTTFALAGSGVASPLGAVSYQGTVVVTSAAGSTTLTDVLTETLTTASGDSITLRCDQTATPVGSTGVLHGVDRWTVVGGTGRYAKASGSGTGDTYVYNLKAFTKTATGSISF